jgi:hypothetical protein
MKILFILKKRIIQTGNEKTTFSSGLLNSANFINEMLIKSNVESKLVEVIDNNGIDKEVHEFKPDIVIIEALWVIPEKFEILCKLHPKVKWIVRLHSHIPFLSNEGIAIKWIKEYRKYPDVYISSNYIPCVEALTKNFSGIIYLPNYYPNKTSTTYNYSKYKHPKEIHVGCFGAIRPMKNQLIQAMAALSYANKNGKTLYFHINGQRIEQNGDSALKNIEALFEETNHILIKHPWLSHEEFLKLISKMDIGLQVSLSETFNIVTADFISQSIPIVTSPEISIVGFLSKSDPKNASKIERKIKQNLFLKDYVTKRNTKILNKFSKESKRIWLDFLNQNFN